MRFCIIAGTVLAVGAWNASAQVTHPPPEPTQACLDFNWSVVSQIEEGRLADAEAALSKAVTGRGDLRDEPCAWLRWQNAANIAQLQGRLGEAERLAWQSFRIVDRLFPANDPRRLPPLHLLWSVQWQSGKRDQARRIFETMLQLRLDKPRDRAMVHGAAALELQVEGKFAESEVEYRGALSAGEEAGRGESADQAITVCGLGLLYLDQKRFADADLAMGRAFALLKNARDAVPSDYVNMIQSRATLHARQKQWTAAEQDLRSAIALADGAQLDPARMKVILASHAYVLRKAHRRAEARAIEARAAAIHDPSAANALVDISELRTGQRKNKRP